MTFCLVRRTALPLLLPALLLLGCQYSASIQVNSVPEGASIWLDGEETGFVTNHLFENVYAGYHLVELVSSGFRWSDSFTLRRNETRTVNAILPDLKWQYTISGYGYTSPPAVGPDGTVYVSTGDNLYALDASGQPAWRCTLAYSYSDPPPPAVGDDGTVYVMTSYAVVAVSPGGQVRWRSTIDGGSARGLALASDGTVYAVTSQTLYAFGAQGDTAWRYDLGYGTGQSAPAVGPDGVIYVGCSGGLVAVNADGTRRWWRELSGYYSSAGSSLALAYDGTVYATGGQRLFAVQPDGVLRWQFDSLEFYGGSSGPAVGANGDIYAFLGGQLSAVAGDGTLRWSLDDQHYYESRTVPAAISDANIAVGWGSTFYLVDTAGETRLSWFQSSGYGWKSAAITQDSLLVISNGHNVYAVRIGAGPAASSWPMLQHDSRRSGRAGAR